MREIKIGTNFQMEKKVDETMLASYVGSGMVNVYATPMMVALMEETAVACIQDYMEEQETTVGTLMNTSHDAPTPCGMLVRSQATVIKVEGRKISFEIVAEDEKGVIGKAYHERFLVIKDTFENRANAKLIK